MIKLTVGNSVSTLEGLSVEQLKDLRKLLSYEIDSQAAYFSGNPNTIRYLLSKRGSFPTGLLYLVDGYLTKTGADVNIRDLREPPKRLPGLFVGDNHATPYGPQQEAATACLNATRGVVVASTGYGKSMIITLILKLLQVPTLIIVPTLELKRQLTATLRGIFGADRVGPLGSTCAVENIDALNVTKPLKGYGALIVDEYHHAAAATYRKLNTRCWNDVYYRFGLTATPWRSKDNERLLLESFLSQVIYQIHYADAVREGRIVPMEAYFYDLPVTKTQGSTWAKVYSDLVVNNEVRNRLIASLVDRLAADNKSTLVLVKEIAHGERLKELTGVPFANGLNDQTADLIADFNSKASGSLIGTTGVLGEGVDTKPAEYIVIAGLGKSRVQFYQQIGRGFRIYPGKESCKIILLRDRSHRWAVNHFNAQVKYLAEFGVKPVKLELP